jgi:ribosome biogenesis protein MAK21
MLFTLTHVGTFNTCIQALTLLHRIQQNYQSITDRYYRALYQTLLDKRILTASRQSLYLNLLFKSLKQDTAMNRISSFVKRMLQVCAYLGTPFVCATLFLIGQLALTHSGIWSLITVAEDGAEEQFVDAADSDEEVTVDSEEKVVKPKAAKKSDGVYDGMKREPLYSDASKSCLWELVCFVNFLTILVAFC